MKMENSFKSFIDSTTDFVFLKDENLNYIFVNEAFLEFIGKDEEEILGKKDIELLPKELAEQCEKSDKKALESGEITTIEETGNQIFETRKFRVKLNEKEIGVCGLVRDITFRKNMEVKLRKRKRELRKSKKRYRNLSEKAPVGILTCDNMGRIEYVNKKMLEILGSPRKENTKAINLLNFSLLKKAGFSQTLKKCLETGEPQKIETKYKSKWGKSVWARVHISPLRQDNSIKGAQIIADDISDRKKAQQALRESKEKFSTAFESSPIGLSITTIDGKYIEVNDVLCKMLGYSRDELIGTTIIDLGLINAPDIKDIMKVLKDSSGSIHNTEVTINRKDGSKRDILLSVEPISLQGNIYYLVTAVDITKRKRAKRKLKKLNRLKSKLISRTSHELKTPLVSIKGYADLILRLDSEDLSQNVKKMVGEIRKGCKRLETLVKDILNTSKLNSGKEQLKKEEIDMAQIIRSAVDSVNGLRQSRKQSIHLDIHESLLTKGDTNKLLEVLENLLSNAIKYTPPGGEISIGTELSDEKIIVSVKDDGIGFTEEEKQELFTEFGKIERYGEGYDVNSQGSGLGLYISKKIIESHGGTIWMESEGRHKGSTFFFSLPKKD